MCHRVQRTATAGLGREGHAGSRGDLHEKAPVGWSNDGGPGLAGPREEGPSGGVAALGLVLEGEDSEVAHGLAWSLHERRPVLTSWPSGLGPVS